MVKLSVWLLTMFGLHVCLKVDWLLDGWVTSGLIPPLSCSFFFLLKAWVTRYNQVTNSQHLIKYQLDWGSQGFNTELWFNHVSELRLWLPVTGPWQWSRAVIQDACAEHSLLSMPFFNKRNEEVQFPRSVHYPKHIIKWLFYKNFGRKAGSWLHVFMFASKCWE